MTADELPEDPSSWPEDPFAVLGVARGVAETDLKRAYTRLIRRFKPEHFPEQFRRIREAYDFCRQLLEWRRFDPEPLPEPVEVGPAESRPTVRDAVDLAWDPAVAGENGAYGDLVRLAAEFPDRADVPLRLYWLLLVDPERDPDRSRHDWLAAALVRADFRGPAMTLFQRELESDPCRVGYGPFEGQLERVVGSEAVMTLARLRIAAAGRARMPLVLAADLARIQDRAAEANETAWLYLLSTAADWAAWMHDVDLDRVLAAAFGRLRHLELAHPGVFDRLEEVKRVASDGLAAVDGGLPEPLVDIARLVWCGYWDLPVDEVIRAATEVRDWFAGKPGTLDSYLQARGPMIPSLFAQALDRVRSILDPDEKPYPPELLRGLVRFLPPTYRNDYPPVRRELFELLTAETVDPFEMVQALHADPDDRFRVTIGMNLATDVGLRVLWLCRQLAGPGGRKRKAK